MYKKIVLFSVLLCPLTEYADDLRPWLEIKPSYFFFQACPMNKIYNKGGFQVQGSASVPYRNYFDFYGSIGYRQAWGHALNTCDKTNLMVIPIDIGLKPVFNFYERYYGFLAIGPRFFYFHQHNNSPYIASDVTGGGIGLFVNGGVNMQVTDYFVLGIFGEYSYEKIATCSSMSNCSNTTVQIGGFAVGINLGYAF